MDDEREAEILHKNSANCHQAEASVGWLPGEFLTTTSTTCTHTHTCNPPGPYESHTHTCFHAHTQRVASEEGNHNIGKDSMSRRPSGNREAVRKYREKKKAQTAHLEEEVRQLRTMNQELMKKLQRNMGLEAELARLRGLLTDLRGKIETEIQGYNFHRPHNARVHSGCNNPYPTSSNQLKVSWRCQPPLMLDCRGNVEGQTVVDTLDSHVSSVSQGD